MGVTFVRLRTARFAGSGECIGAVAPGRVRDHDSGELHRLSEPSLIRVSRIHPIACPRSAYFWEFLSDKA
jgi:hypothetical protein